MKLFLALKYVYDPHPEKYLKVVIGVFDSEEEARKCIMEFDQADIEELTLNRQPNFVYFVKINKEGKILKCYKYLSEDERTFISENDLYVFKGASTKEDAIEFAKQKYREMMVEETVTRRTWKDKS